MHMNINLLFKIILIALGISYIGLQAFQLELVASAVCAIFMVLLTIFYRSRADRYRSLFFWFLVLFSAAQVIGYLNWYITDDWRTEYDLPYYIANLCSIGSYIVLIAHCLEDINFKHVLKRYTGSAIVLLLLDIFCVYIVTDTASSGFSYGTYILELSYNSVIMILLSVALLNYLNNDTNKSMLFLVGAIFIVLATQATINASRNYIRDIAVKLIVELNDSL